MATKTAKITVALISLSCISAVVGSYFYKMNDFTARLRVEYPNSGISPMAYVPWPFGDRLLGKVSPDGAAYLAAQARQGSPIETETLKITVHASDGTVFIDDL
jgi:hypothetical protein